MVQSASYSVIPPSSPPNDFPAIFFFKDDKYPLNKFHPCSTIRSTASWKPDFLLTPHLVSNNQQAGSFHKSTTRDVYILRPKDNTLYSRKMLKCVNLCKRRCKWHLKTGLLTIKGRWNISKGRRSRCTKGSQYYRKTKSNTL